jgi:hypothetical protein
MSTPGIADFPPASLTIQLSELERERTLRTRLYPLFVAKGQITERKAAYQMNALDGAIATLRRLIAQEADEARRRFLAEQEPPP